MPRSLESFTIVRVPEGYVLQIEDDDGDTRELVATIDHLELIADEIERHFLLDEDDEQEEPMILAEENEI